MSICIKRQCYINRPPETVFATLCDFSAYERWNPWVVAIKGSCVEGEDVAVRAKLGKKIGQFQHRILKVDAPYVLHWCDKGWFTRLAYGERKRVLTAEGEGTQYQVMLTISGCMSGVVKHLYGEHLEKGMTAETHALQQWVERNHG